MVTHERPASVLMSSCIDATPLASVAVALTLAASEFAGTFIGELFASVTVGAVTIGACASRPDPLSVITWTGLLFALSLTSSRVDCGPGLVGANFTVSAQLFASASVAPAVHVVDVIW